MTILLILWLCATVLGIVGAAYLAYRVGFADGYEDRDMQYELAERRRQWAEENRVDG